MFQRDLKLYLEPYPIHALFLYPLSLNIDLCFGEDFNNSVSFDFFYDNVYQLAS